MSRISQRARAGIAAFALPLLMSSAALTFEMNVNPDGVRGGGPCSEESGSCSPRQTRPVVPGVSPALSDVLGRGSSHRNRIRILMSKILSQHGERVCRPINYNHSRRDRGYIHRRSSHLKYPLLLSHSIVWSSNMPANKALTTAHGNALGRRLKRRGRRYHWGAVSYGGYFPG